MRTINSPFDPYPSTPTPHQNDALQPKPQPSSRDNTVNPHGNAASTYPCDFADAAVTPSIIHLPRQGLTVAQKQLLQDYHDMRIHRPMAAPGATVGSVRKKRRRLGCSRAGIKSIEEILLLRRALSNQEESASGSKLETVTVTASRFNSGDETLRPATAKEVTLLAEECRDVVKRIEALEQSKSLQRPVTVTGSRPRSREYELGKLVALQEGKGLDTDDAMLRNMDGIQQTLAQLDHTLTPQTKMDQIEVGRQYAAVTRIVAVYRGCSVRKKSRAAILALRAWRMESGMQEVCYRYRFLKQRRDVLRRKCKEMHEQRLIRRKLACFNALVEYRVMMRPVKERLQSAIHTFLARVNTQLVKAVFRSWHDEAFGPHSRKAVKQRNKERYREMRNKLEEEQQLVDQRRQKKITHDVIVEALGKEAVQKLMAQQGTTKLKIYFKAWSRDALHKLNFMKKTADAFRRKHALPRFFGGWKEYVEVAQDQAKVHRSWIRTGFDVRHNSQKIASYWRVKTLHRYFSQLRKTTDQLRAVREKIARVDSSRKRLALKEWKKQAHFQKKVKGLCIAEWKRFSRVWREVPFKAWYLWLQQKKRRREKQEILIAAFRRRQNRRRQTRCFRTWSHQTLYGRVDGMLSRADLIDAFNRQKRSCTAMEIAMENAKLALKQTSEALEKERETVATMSQEVSAKMEETLEHKCTQERLEAEVIRLQSLLDSMAEIHPGTARRLQMDTETKDQREFSKTTRTAAMKGNFATNDGVSPDFPLPPPKNDDGSGIKDLEIDAMAPEEDSRRAVSARLRMTDKQQSTMMPNLNGVEDLVWVTREDSDMLFRCEWAKKKLMQLLKERSQTTTDIEETTTRSEAGDGVSQALQGEEGELKAQRIYQLLSFLFTGDLHCPRFTMPGSVTEKPSRIDPIDLTVLDPTLVWNDFVQSISAEFRLKHPLNANVRDKIEARIFHTHSHAYEKQLHKASPLNIYSTGA